MRVVPLITATLVLLALYMFVMERETLQALAGIDAAAQSAPSEQVPDAAVATDDAALFAVVVERFSERDMEGAIVLRGRTATSRQVDGPKPPAA